VTIIVVVVEHREFSSVPTQCLREEARQQLAQPMAMYRCCNHYACRDMDVMHLASRQRQQALLPTKLQSYDCGERTRNGLHVTTIAQASLAPNVVKTMTLLGSQRHAGVGNRRNERVDSRKQAEVARAIAIPVGDELQHVGGGVDARLVDKRQMPAHAVARRRCCERRAQPCAAVVAPQASRQRHCFVQTLL
jgi:hypothetical protein